MSKIYVITTHHKHPIAAAEAWKRDEVCAIGWSDKGDLRKVNIKSLNADCRLFLEIERDDLILAYAKHNTISWVGKIADGEYIYTSDNEVGNLYGYHNQYRVQWWPEPRHFRRNNLPSFFADQLGVRGRTVVRLDLGSRSYSNTVQLIKTCAISNSADTDLNEENIKSGLRNYLIANKDLNELGLKILQVEKHIAADKRPDFIGHDAQKREVIIECKGTATGATCEQIMGYGKAVGGKPRLLIIAYRFDEDCKRLAKRNGIELIECRLELNKIVLDSQDI